MCILNNLIVKMLLLNKIMNFLINFNYFIFKYFIIVLNNELKSIFKLCFNKNKFTKFVCNSLKEIFDKIKRLAFLFQEQNDLKNEINDKNGAQQMSPNVDKLVIELEQGVQYLLEVSMVDAVSTVDVRLNLVRLTLLVVTDKCRTLLSHLIFIT